MSDSLRIARALAQSALAGVFAVAAAAFIQAIVTGGYQPPRGTWLLLTFLAVTASTFLLATRPGGAR